MFGYVRFSRGAGLLVRGKYFGLTTARYHPVLLLSHLDTSSAIEIMCSNYIAFRVRARMVGVMK